MYNYKKDKIMMKIRIASILALLILMISCSEDDSSSNNPNGNITANLQNTGASSNDLLSASIFTSMVIEMVYVEGYEPTESAKNSLLSFLDDRTFKPNGITIQERSIPSPGLSSYSINDITNIETANRTKYNAGNQIAVWVFFADAPSSSSGSSGVVLGTAYRNTSFVIFEDDIHNYSDSALEPSRSVLESVVIEHEFGHLLGLTNLGAPLQSPHEDSEHPKHCDDENCLMYWAAETGDGILNMLSGGTVPTLDSACIADLQANGGK